MHFCHYQNMLSCVVQIKNLRIGVQTHRHRHTHTHTHTLHYISGYNKYFILQLSCCYRKNYLEVRIFFEEMNIDTTVQKPAYEAGDLLGKSKHYKLPIVTVLFE